MNATTIKTPWGWIAIVSDERGEVERSPGFFTTREQALKSLTMTELVDAALEEKL